VNPEDLQKLMGQAQAAQAKLADVQKQLAAKRVEGSAGGGMVKAVATGALRILEGEIEPSLLASGDRELIQDLTAAAVNAALTNAQNLIQQEMQRASAGLALPNLGDLFRPGGGG